jgi:hypothetical protein
MSTVPLLKLNNGVEMPALGFGVFRTPPEETLQIEVHPYFQQRDVTCSKAARPSRSPPNRGV